ncbi:acyl-CoA thioesterase [Anaerolineales bacterium]
MSGKTVSHSHTSLSILMGPADSNSLGNVHGGVIMKKVDEAGALAAMRHAQNPVVTVAIDSMTFLRPIHIGMLLICNAELTYVGNTSIEARIEVIAENPITGEHWVSNTAYAVYVALDKEGRPTRVPPLILETPLQQKRALQAKVRQDFRKSQKRDETL